MSINVDKLLEARNLIADPKHWTQGNAAKDINGLSVLPSSVEAYQFCGIGALVRSSVDNSSPEYRLLSAVSIDLYNLSLVSLVNDRLGHKAILAVYDEAIRRAKDADCG